jgi:hypothetical protein
MVCLSGNVLLSSSTERKTGNLYRCHANQCCKCKTNIYLMPMNLKSEPPAGTRVPRRTRLAMPVIGLESEFNVWLDEVEIVPEDYWKHPTAFIDQPLLPREKTSSHLPTGGAVYFDRGVIEVVTPVIEIAPGCTARVVRNLWEQIGFVRAQLTGWEKRTGHTVRLKAYSTHYNISFELRKREQNANRNIKKLALLLAYILPVPVMLTGGNRRSTGVGVRPRGDRIEVTVDFTPDPGLMIASATLIVGIVREVISWPSYELSLLDELPIPTIADVIPGKHTTRKGWLTKDFHYPRSPYTSDVNARIWKTRNGEIKSLRQIAAETTWFFRRMIRQVSDPFSFRLLFAIMSGRAPSMLELVDRPTAYEDVGRLCQWGMVIHELKNYEAELELLQPRHSVWDGRSIDEYVAGRAQAREGHVADLSAVNGGHAPSRRPMKPQRGSKGAEASILPPTADLGRQVDALPSSHRHAREANSAAWTGDRRSPHDRYGSFGFLQSTKEWAAQEQLYRPIPRPSSFPLFLRAGLSQVGIGRTSESGKGSLHADRHEGLVPRHLPAPVGWQGAPPDDRSAPEKDGRLAVTASG